MNSTELAPATSAVSKTIADMRAKLKSEQDELHHGLESIQAADGKRGSYEAKLELEYAGESQGRKSKDCTHDLADWGLEFYQKLVDGNGARQYVQFAIVNSTSGAVCGFYESVNVKPASSKRDTPSREALSSPKIDIVKEIVVQSGEVE